MSEPPEEWKAWVTAQLAVQAAEHDAQIAVLFGLMAAACEAAGIPSPARGGEDASLAAAVDRACREGRHQGATVMIGGEAYAVSVGPEASAAAGTLAALRDLAGQDDG